MIEWVNFIANSFWILACAIALATLSHAGWAASILHENLGIILATPNYNSALHLAGILFCLGLGGISDKWWEITISLLFALLLLQLLFRLHKPRP